MAGKLSLHSGDSPLKMLIQLMQIGPDGMVQRSVSNGIVRRLRRPGEHFIEGVQLVGDFVLAQISAQTIPSKLKQLGR